MYQNHNTLLRACFMHVLGALSGSVFRGLIPPCAGGWCHVCAPLGRAHHLSRFWCNSLGTRAIKREETWGA